MARQQIAQYFYDPEAGYTFDIRRVLGSLIGGGALAQLHGAKYQGEAKPGEEPAAKPGEAKPREETF
jgi:hypothetical protein